MRRDMNFKNYDVALITDEKQRMYFLGFHSTAGYVLITKEKLISSSITDISKRRKRL